MDIGSGFNDDPLMADCRYLPLMSRETGDFSHSSKNRFPLTTMKQLAAPLMEHLKRSFDYTL